MSEQTSAPAGWYPVADMPGTQRYWDGSKWTEHVAPLAPTPAPAVAVEPEKDQSGLIVAGIFIGLVIPLIGFVIGCVLLSKRPGAAVAILVLSVISAVMWLNYLTTR